MNVIRMTLGAAGLAVGLAGGAAAEEWIMASGYAEANFHTKNIRMFIDEVAKNSGGKLKITLHSNDTLIKLDAIKRAVQSGQIPIGEMRLGVYGNEDPAYILDGLPFIAGDYDSSWKLKDAQRPYFDKLFAKNGMRILFYSPWPGQGFYTKFKIESLDNLKGKKLRIYSTVTKKMGDLLGFNATILPFAEIPQAFSTGLIEALFTSPQTGIDIQAWDNTSDFTYVGANFTKNAVIVNERAWRKLPQDVRDVILAAAKTAEKRGYDMSKETTEFQMGILKKNGMTITKEPGFLIARLKEVGKEMMVDWRKDASPEANATLDAYIKSIR